MTMTMTMTKTLTKTRYILIFVVAWTGNIAAAVNDSLLIKPLEIAPDAAGSISVEMNNTDAIWGVQFDLIFPSWMHLNEQETKKAIELNAERFPNTESAQGIIFKHTLAYNMVSENCLRVLVYSLDPQLFINGNSGELMTIAIHTDDSVKTGTYSLGISNIDLVLDGTNDVQPQASATDITVVGRLLGDANGDGFVTVSDFTAIANHILNQTPENFDKKAADVNKDGEISVSDLTGVANIILGR